MVQVYQCYKSLERASEAIGGDLKTSFLGYEESNLFFFRDRPDFKSGYCIAYNLNDTSTLFTATPKACRDLNVKGSSSLEDKVNFISVQCDKFNLDYKRVLKSIKSGSIVEDFEDLASAAEGVSGLVWEERGYLVTELYKLSVTPVTITSITDDLTVDVTDDYIKRFTDQQDVNAKNDRNLQVKEALDEFSNFIGDGKTDAEAIQKINELSKKFHSKEEYDLFIEQVKDIYDIEDWSGLEVFQEWKDPLPPNLREFVEKWRGQDEAKILRVINKVLLNADSEQRFNEKKELMIKGFPALAKQINVIPFGKRVFESFDNIKQWFADRGYGAKQINDTIVVTGLNWSILPNVKVFPLVTAKYSPLIEDFSKEFDIPIEDK